ncbi:MAG: DNA-binding protein HU-beta [bacterium]|jgi:DNA-binding protein HU-beta
MSNVTKADLISSISKKAEVTKAVAEKSLNAFISTVQNELSEGKTITLVGFGTFTTVERKERKGRNPQTGKEINIPATTIPKFRPGKNLKEAVN